jgi:hypothetical protein
MMGKPACPIAPSSMYQGCDTFCTGKYCPDRMKGIPLEVKVLMRPKSKQVGYAQ